MDRAFSIAVDGSGSAYIMGETSDADYPTTTGAYQSGVSGGASFVTKLGGAGNTLVYSTYLRDANAYALAVDGNGNAYVTGIALSGFVTTTGVIQVASPYPSGSSPFVIKLNPAGSAPVYSTFLGGSGAGSSSYVPDVAVALAVDSVGNAYIAGRADSTDFPTVNAFAATQAVGYDAFISKINPSGTALSYSTYLGGSRGDYALAVAVDTAGSAYVTGFTASADFPIKNAFQVSNPGNTTQGSSIVAFVTKLSPRGTDLAYSSYLGGGCGTPGGSYCLIDSPDRGNAITVDSQGHAFVAGSITSNRFPLVDSIEPGSSDLASGWFVAQVSRSGSSLLYSTLLGGSSESAINLNFGPPDARATSDAAYGVALDGVGNVYVAGSTSRTTFPVTSGTFKTTNAGDIDAAIVKLKSSAAAVSINSSENPTTAGKTVTLTATVTGVSASGTVTFLDGPTTLGSANVVDGTATLTTSFGVGVRRLVAIYRDGTDVADTPTLYQVIDQPVVCN